MVDYGWNLPVRPMVRMRESLDAQTHPITTPPASLRNRRAAIRITEPLRSALLRRPLKPSVTRDADVPGLRLIVTRSRSFWAIVYQLRGTNPATGRRWGGGARQLATRSS